jgi:hypothetical protein
MVCPRITDLQPVSLDGLGQQRLCPVTGIHLGNEETVDLHHRWNHRERGNWVVMVVPKQRHSDQAFYAGGESRGWMT